MEYLVISIILVVLLLCMILYMKQKKKREESQTGNLIEKKSQLTEHTAEELGELIIQLEQLPVSAVAENTKLVEISDSKVLAHINNLVPGLLQAGNVAGNAIQAAQANEQILYQAIIPAGAKLANSRYMQNAVRGFYHGAEGVKGHADFVAVQQNANAAVDVATNTIASAMNVSALIVGQYYMEQINSQLDVINEGITKISEFQDNEYKSKVFALVAQIQKVAKFKMDILENNELRLSEIDNLNQWEQECIWC